MVVVIGSSVLCGFFFNVTALTDIYTDGHTLSLPDALPIWLRSRHLARLADARSTRLERLSRLVHRPSPVPVRPPAARQGSEYRCEDARGRLADRKSTRLNSSH